MLFERYRTMICVSMSIEMLRRGVDADLTA